MKFAISNGERREAEPKLIAECPNCSSPMIAKCGTKKVHHWAHRGRLECDPWWENETEWHRAWKNKFPKEWQERVHSAADGEKHIADVKTPYEWVLEFQNSPISAVERDSRNAFYGKIMWVVNGLKRKRDLARFQRAIIHRHTFENNPLMRRFFNVTVHESALIDDWAGSNAPIFFDFGEEILWCLLSHNPNRGNFVVEFSRAGLVDLHRAGEPTDHALNLFRNLDAAAMQLTNNWQAQDQLRMLQQQRMHAPRPLYRQPRRHFRF